MILDETKKAILKIKLISSIILSFLKLRDIHFSQDSTNIIDTIGPIKNISNLFYDLLSFNVFSLLLNFFQYYKRIKDSCKYVINKIINIKKND